MSSEQLSKVAEETVGILVKLAHYVEIYGRSQGLVRFRTSFSDLPKAMALLGSLDVQRGLKLIPGLKAHEVSAWSRTATIHYDPQVIPEDFWNDFGAVKNNPSKEGVVRERILALFDNCGNGSS